MNSLNFLHLILTIFALLPASAQAQISAPRIVGVIPDGSQVTAVVPQKLPAAAVKQAWVQRMGNGDAVTVQLVAAPARGVGTAVFPTTVVPIEADAVSAVVPRVSSRSNSLPGFGGSVYAGAFSRVEWRFAGEQYEAWLNFDFNDLGGISGYEVTEASGEVVQQSYFLSFGNEDAAALAALRKAGQGPPKFANATPAFILTAGNPNNLAATLVLREMVALYRAEGPRLKAAHQGRVAAEAKPKPAAKPADVVVRFWKEGTR